MSRYFKSVNKGSVQLDVFYGWDIDVKEWFIDIKMTGFSGGNLVQWFNSEKNYQDTLKNILV
ncbi:MAG: hypothetical protein CMP32_04025 [Rickettsiales bacterium]|nr:hypothetical protein [Rickettsiales bacterium]|tara:strand:- start:49 stop:234 length:186 start_codon:yes stop_codon:yes gene_type:complete